jgi:hypothetical protein
MFKEANTTGNRKSKLTIAIFLPWILSLMFAQSPIYSYLIAWSGSFFIFYCTILSPIRCVSQDEELRKRIMRPIVLLQLVFAGFMCCTSIFFFLNHIGYEYLHNVNANNFVINDTTYQLANCQRYYVLAHAALVVGLILVNEQSPPIFYTFNKRTDQILIPISILSFVCALVLSRLPAMAQFSYMLRYVAAFSGTLTLVKGIRYRNTKLVVYGATWYVYDLLSSSLTGYKEGVIINILLLLFLLYPYYTKLISYLCVPILGGLLYILPTLATTIRAQVWSGSDTAEQARSDAFRLLTSTDPVADIQQTNWDFLNTRFSEVGMFTQFVVFVPFQHDYYGFQILKNSLYSLVPRALWENKPNTEALSMQRVYEAGVINRQSDASAKTRPIVDGYLSGGPIGIVLVMLFYGIIAQLCCNQAERYFGGYETGCIVFFNGVFQQLWRGNNLEFLINNVFYGFILMMFLFHLLRFLKILLPIEECTYAIDTN